MTKLPLADCWIIANYPVFRAGSDGSPFGDQIILNAYILPYDRLSGICNAALNIIEFAIQYYLPDSC